MDKKIHRFKVGYDGDILEIVNPIELNFDRYGGLLKAVWVDEKGVKQIIEWNENEQRYNSNAERQKRKPKTLLIGRRLK